MKSVRKLTFPLWGLFMFIAIWASGNTPAKSDAGMLDAVDVNLSLDTPSTIEAGIPIILHYKIVNVLEDQTIGAYTGMYKNAWYSLSLKDSTGLLVAALPPEQLLSPGGLQPTETSTVTPGGSEAGYIVVSRYYAPANPGKYVLTIHADIQYAIIASTEHNSSLIKHEVDTSNTRFSKDYNFSLTLTAADVSHLRLRAEALQREIQTEQDHKKLSALLDALFSMPEAQVAPSWTALANNPRQLYEGDIADELARLHTEKTVDLLVQMLDNPNLSSDAKYYVRTKIDESYNAGDAKVKTHIKFIAAARSGEMPEKVIIPQAAD